ncbi:transglycosylase domain-containing protein [Dysgonomonas sp. ZJ279]|uniref:transglycosylase domain-containing protein n=1 Tax=Dysgonomonas sp. ZJ279 TaxID=2709796 RepID=UPI0013EDFE43|nr:transglycosylase domain-containing protein [Dysgonomonas sp. ZJ279]
MSKKTKKNKNTFFKQLSPNKIVKALWVLFIAGIVSVTLIFILIGTGIIGYMPPIKDLENPIDKYASQVYSVDGQLLGTFSQDKNNRINSSYSDLSPYLVEALVATEDARYYSHSGIDIFALIRAVVKTGILQQSSGGGGSTISQQLSKQLYSPTAENVVERVLQKPIEWVIAVQLERYYTKDEIINLYLNKFDFLYNAVGIQSAAQVYFNKTPKDLKIEEAATLIGMCKNPSYYNPLRKNERTRGRRNVVLEQMYNADYITKQELDSLKQLPLVLDFKKVDHKDGLAPYFREYLRMAMNAKKPSKSNYASWQTEQFASDSLQWETNPLYGWCSKNKKADGSNYNLTTDGLKIYSTIDSRMQKYAEEAVEEHFSKELQPDFDREKKGRSYAPFSSSVAKNVDSLLLRAMKVTDRYRGLKNQGLSEKEILKEFKTPTDMKVFSWKGEIDTTMTPWDSIRYHKGFLRTGFMAMDTQTGFVRAYVGGIDFKYFQYDMVNMGRRQVGSTIKPYLYTLAMEEGMTPCDEMLHVEQVLITETGKEWRPRNASARRVGEVVTIKWGLQNSDNWVTAYLMKQTSPYTFARLLHSFGITGRIDPVVSMSLGTHDVSVAEMTAAYTAFANKGIRSNPIYVTHIEDMYGNIVATFTPKLDEVFGESTYVKMIDMLRGVVDGGTGGRVRRNYGITAPMGGKTGTTQNNSDGWYMGFTPKLSAGCWVGGEDRSIHFDRTSDGQGASMALPIFGLFMKKVYADPDLEYKQTDQFQSAKYSPCDRASDDDDIIDHQPVVIDKMFN